MNSTTQQSNQQNADDLAVDRFCAALKAKMAKQRAKGYGGWDDKAQCPTERLQSMLKEHLEKGDPVDVGNFAMMLFNRNESTSLPQTPQSSDLISREKVVQHLLAHAEATPTWNTHDLLKSIAKEVQNLS